MNADDVEFFDRYTWVRTQAWPRDVWECDGYVIRAEFEGGTGRRVYVATNPDGGRRSFTTLEGAKKACEAGIERRRCDGIPDDEKRARRLLVASQINAMKEMLK